MDVSEIENKPFDPKKSFLKIPHKTFHTDFLPQVTGLDSFSTSKKNCSILTIGDLQLDILSFSDLTKNKQAVNREIDKADLEALKKKQHD